MHRLWGVVISIGLADSLNPSTIAPALYLASREHARSRVVEFTIAVFTVYLAGGAIILLGPGQLLLSIVPHPHRTVRFIIEIIVGVTLVIGSGVVWRARGRLSKRRLPRPRTTGRSSALLGATITAVELPTAFPYFAAIAAIVGSGIGAPRQIVLLVLFNICFVLPLIAIVLTVLLAGDRSEEILGRARRFMERNWPPLLATVMLLAGAFVILLGATGLASAGHNRFGRFVRRFRRSIHP